jgi:hypothetical protein
METSPNTSDSESNIFDEYSEYNKIESHIIFSKNIFLLKAKGRNILKEFEIKKYESKNRKGSIIFIPDITIIYNNISNIVEKKRHSLKLCFCLTYYLDELMFGEIKTLDNFIIEDQLYDLTKLYSHPEEWIDDQEIQNVSLDSEKNLNINESMLLVCYLKEFENFFLEIEEYLKSFKDSYKIKKKILRIINRFRLKFKNIWDIILKIINNNI